MDMRDELGHAYPPATWRALHDGVHTLLSELDRYLDSLAGWATKEDDGTTGLTADGLHQERMTGSQPIAASVWVARYEHRGLVEEPQKNLIKTSPYLGHLLNKTRGRMATSLRLR